MLRSIHIRGEDSEWDKIEFIKIDCLAVIAISLIVIAWRMGNVVNNLDELIVK